MADFDFIGALGQLPKMDVIKSDLGSMASFSGASLQVRNSLHLYAAAIAQSMLSKVTPTQLRRFYTYVKSIDLANRNQPDTSEDIQDKYKLLFILPKIAGTGEEERKNLHGLYEILAQCLLRGEKIKTVGDLRIFVEFFEAIVDYHASLPKKDFNSNRRA